MTTFILVPYVDIKTFVTSVSRIFGELGLKVSKQGPNIYGGYSLSGSTHYGLLNSKYIDLQVQWVTRYSDSTSYHDTVKDNNIESMMISVDVGTTDPFDKGFKEKAHHYELT